MDLSGFGANGALSNIPIYGDGRHLAPSDHDD